MSGDSHCAACGVGVQQGDQGGETVWLAVVDEGIGLHPGTCMVSDDVRHYVGSQS